MKERRGVANSVAVFLVALIVVSGTVAGFYFVQYNSQVATSTQYAAELRAANSKFNQTATDYNLLLSQYNESLTLLSESVALLNTSSPVYQEASTQLTALWKTYLSLKPAATGLYTADILIDFGNGTRTWYNGTSVQPGWNLYILTLVLTSGKMEAQWYPQYGEHLVTGLDGVSNSVPEETSWFFWSWNSTSKWQSPAVGADDVNVYNGSVFAWTYCKYDPSTYAPLCTPP